MGEIIGDPIYESEVDVGVLGKIDIRVYVEKFPLEKMGRGMKIPLKDTYCAIVSPPPKNLKRKSYSAPFMARLAAKELKKLFENGSFELVLGGINKNSIDLYVGHKKDGKYATLEI